MKWRKVKMSYHKEIERKEFQKRLQQVANSVITIASEQEKNKQKKEKSK